MPPLGGFGFGAFPRFAGVTEARSRRLGVNTRYLPQEPELNPHKDIRGNVEEGVAATKALIDRFSEVSMRFAEPMSPEEMDELLAEQGRLQDAIEAAGA